MIEFCGNLQGQARKFAIKQMNKISVVASIIVAVLVAIAAVLLAVFVDIIILVFLVLSPAVVLAAIFAKPSKEAEANYFPKQIHIYKDTLVCKGENFEYERELSFVESVVDYGEFYQILFDIEHECDKFICQKNLITQGSLDDFEQLFNGKIERKVTNTTVK